jgi:hypothetical protein
MDNFRFTLLDCETHEHKKIKCVVLNYKTHETFNININWNYRFIKKIRVSCNCEEQKLLKVCQHIKWLGNTHLNSKNPRHWYSDILEIFKEKNTIYEKTIGKNDECIICFDIINYDIQNTVHCKKCNNSIHNLCWNKYNKINGFQSNICVICQSTTMPVSFDFH